MPITLVDIASTFFAGGGDTYCTRYFEIASVTDADDTDEVTVQLTDEVELDACSGDGELLLTGINEIASELWEK